MQVELTELESSTNRRTIVLEALPVMIGQSPEAAVRLEDHWVSRQHCELSAINDTLVVRDLGSMLGTFVNGLNVTTARLMPGDKLTVGITSFLVDYHRITVARSRRRPRPEMAPLPPVQLPAEPAAALPGEPGGAEVPARRSRLVARMFRRVFERFRRKPR
jgi:pSer/pThr/pTyr-binding forkhead associated (FHA) protein